MSAPPPPPPATSAPPGAKPPATRKKWATVDTAPAVEWKPRAATSVSADVESVSTRWGQLTDCVCSATGSEGVWFVRFPDEGVVVLKASLTVAADHLAYMLAEAATCIPMPRQRLVFYQLDSEYDVMTNPLEVLKKAKLDKFLTKPIITVMQYLKGSDLESSNLISFTPESLIQICTDFGSICSYDVLVNNSDRFPVIWDNAGNMGNLFIVSGRGYAIDNAICSIDPVQFPDNFAKYISRVQGFLQIITTLPVDTDLEPINELNVVRKCILEATGFDFGKNLLRYVWIGMLMGIQELCQSLNDAKIAAVYSTMSAKIDQLIAGMSWGIDTQSRYGMTKVNVTFLTGVLAQFNTALPAVQAKLTQLTS